MSSPNAEPYDPFARGPYPVGVRTVTVSGARALPVELWYPADPVHAGDDLDPGRRDRFQVMPAMPRISQAAVRDAALCPGEPRALAIFSHGLGGHRRQSTFLCTHLASHGFIVAAPDHVGTTLLDGLALFMQAPATDRTRHMRPWVLGGIEARPDDLVALLDAILGGAVAELAARVDPARIGVLGHSFGGWTTLQTIGRDARVRAGVALAPAGGHGAYSLDPLADALRLDWTREVPVQLVAGERDSILPLSAMRELYGRLHSPKRLYVLAGADHLHFLDEPQRAHEMFRLMPYLPTALPMPAWSELVPARPAHDALRALTLAHLDRHVRGLHGARDFLMGDVAGALAAHGAALVA